MKTKLLILFLATCMAGEVTPDDYDDWDDYELFKEKFSDILFMNPLDYDLMLNKSGAIPCYQELKEKIEGFAKKYKNDILLTQEYYMALDVDYRPHARNILKTFKKLAEYLVECQGLIWKYLSKNENMQGFHTINNCRKSIEAQYDKYEAELKLIKNQINKNRIETKIRNLNDDVKNKFKNSTQNYKSCMDKFS